MRRLHFGVIVYLAIAVGGILFSSGLIASRNYFLPPKIRAGAPVLRRGAWLGPAAMTASLVLMTGAWLVSTRNKPRNYRSMSRWWRVTGAALIAVPPLVGFSGDLMAGGSEFERLGTAAVLFTGPGVVCLATGELLAWLCRRRKARVWPLREFFRPRSRRWTLDADRKEVSPTC